MVRNLRRSLCALLALALMLAAPAALADWVGAYVGSATKVYQYPSTSSAGTPYPPERL